MKKRITSLMLCLALFLSLTAPGCGDEPLSLDGLMDEIETEAEDIKEIAMDPLTFEVSPDRQSIFINRPNITLGTGYYTIAYNIYDSDSNPVNYFYSDEARVAATPGYGGLFNVFVVVTDTDTGMTANRNIGWTELDWPHGSSLSVGKASFEISPDKKSIFIDRPSIACRSGKVTIAYNIYDSASKPVNYFYSTQKRVAATPGYDGKFNVFIVVTDTVTGESNTQNIGWQVLGNWTEPTEPSIDFTYTVTDGEVTVTGYTGTDANVVIPDQITGKPVTAIGASAFDSNQTITSVKMPDTVIRIGNYAFGGCTSLSDIDLSDSLRSIGRSCFGKCGIKSITLPDSLKEMGEQAFAYCDLLKSVVIPGGVKSISREAFRFCERLNNVTIKNGVGSIEQAAFLDCCSLKTITIPGSCLVIGPGAFQRCEDLTSVTLEEGVQKIEESAFLDCESLAKIIIPESVRYIADDAFFRCGSVVIYCPSGSYAHFWAQKNRFSFVAE